MRKVEMTRQRLKRGALELFVSQGISETTTRQIAAACEMSEGNIYRHYPSKEELARELLADQMTRIAKGLKVAFVPGATVQETVKTLVRAYCQLAEEDWLGFSYHLKFQYGLLGEVELAPEDDPVQLIRTFVTDSIKHGELPRRDVELVIGMGLGVVMQTAVQILYERLEGPLGRYENELSDAVWRVLADDNQV